MRSRFLDAVLRYKLDPDRPAEASVWSPRLERAPRAEIERMQSEKLEAAYAYLFECSPFYRRRFAAAGLGPNDVRSLRDLRRIPVTRKKDWIADIEERPPWGTFSPLSAERWDGGDGWMVFSTSGTTRQPRVFRMTAHDQGMLSWMCARALHAYGVRPNDLALNCFFHGPSVAAWGMFGGLRLLGCPAIAGGPMSSDRRAFFVKHLHPTILLGTPSTLLSLGERLRDLGDDPAAQGVRRLVCAGEPGAAVRSTKARLEALWGAVAHDDFGCTEVAQAPLGYTCEYQAGRPAGEIRVHLMEDTHIVEVLDPDTLDPVPPGTRGTLVVSNLYSESGPYLRYDMGDWVSVTHEPCGCGRTHASAVGGLVGRNDHCVKIKGLQFFPSTFEDALRSIDGIGNEYRIEVRSWRRDGPSSEPAGGAPGSTRPERRTHRDTVTIVAERVGQALLSAREVEVRLGGILGISVSVTLLEPGSLPRAEGKAVRFFDLREAEP